MFYQTPDSDSTFLIAIAIIAGIVIVFVAVATLVLLRSENKKATQAPAKDEPKPVPPAEMTVASPPKEGPEEVLPYIPRIEIVAASAPKENPQDHLLETPSDEITAVSPPKERPQIDSPLIPSVEIAAASPQMEVAVDSHDVPVVDVVPEKQSEDNSVAREWLSSPIVGFLFTAMLIFGLIWVPLAVYISAQREHFLGIDDLPVILACGVTGAALGGFVGIRLASLTWRPIILAGLLAGLGLAVMSRFEFSPFFPGPWDNPDRTLNFIAVPFFMLYSSMGLFLLPLFVGELRNTGLAPSPWKVILTAACLAGGFAILVGALSIQHQPGWSENILILVIVFALLAAWSIGSGLVGGVIKPQDGTGAWAGALGIIFLLFLYLTVTLLGFIQTF